MPIQPVSTTTMTTSIVGNVLTATIDITNYFWASSDYKGSYLDTPIFIPNLYVPNGSFITGFQVSNGVLDNNYNMTTLTNGLSFVYNSTTLYTYTSSQLSRSFNNYNITPISGTATISIPYSSTGNNNNITITGGSTYSTIGFSNISLILILSIPSTTSVPTPTPSSMTLAPVNPALSSNTSLSNFSISSPTVLAQGVPNANVQLFSTNMPLNILSTVNNPTIFINSLTYYCSPIPGQTAAPGQTAVLNMNLYFGNPTSLWTSSIFTVRTNYNVETTYIPSSPIPVFNTTSTSIQIPPNTPILLSYTSGNGSYINLYSINLSIVYQTPPLSTLFLFNNSMYITPSNSSNLNLQNSSTGFTIEFWYYQTSSSTPMNTIIDKGNYCYLVQMNGKNTLSPSTLSPTSTLYNSLDFYTNETGWLNFNIGTGVNINTWTHYALTFAPTILTSSPTSSPVNTLTCYVNGIYNGSFTNLPSIYQNDTGDVNIGRQQPSGCQCNILNNAYLFDLRLWNTALSSSDIQSGMYSQILPNTVGLVANYMMLYDSVGYSSYDSVSNSNALVSGTKLTGNIFTPYIQPLFSSNVTNISPTTSNGNMATVTITANNYLYATNDFQSSKFYTNTPIQFTLPSYIPTGTYLYYITITGTINNYTNNYSNSITTLQPTTISPFNGLVSAIPAFITGVNSTQTTANGIEPAIWTANITGQSNPIMNGTYIATASHVVNYGSNNSNGANNIFNSKNNYISGINWESRFASNIYTTTTGVYTGTTSTTIVNKNTTPYTILGEWVSIQCPYSFILKAYNISSPALTTCSWTIAGNNDGSTNYYIIDQQTLTASTNFNININSNTISYSKYIFIVQSGICSGGGAFIYNLNLYTAPLSDYINYSMNGVNFYSSIINPSSLGSFGCSNLDLASSQLVTTVSGTNTISFVPSSTSMSLIGVSNITITLEFMVPIPTLSLPTQLPLSFPLPTFNVNQSNNTASMTLSLSNYFYIQNSVGITPSPTPLLPYSITPVQFTFTNSNIPQGSLLTSISIPNIVVNLNPFAW